MNTEEMAPPEVTEKRQKHEERDTRQRQKVVVTHNYVMTDNGNEMEYTREGVPTL